MLRNNYFETKRNLLILFSLVAALFAGDRILKWVDKPFVTKTHFVFEMPSELPERIAKQFKVPAHVQTDKVYLVGSFNNWGIFGGDEMRRINENKWEIDVDLPLGKNFYKFRFTPSNVKGAGFVWIHDLKSKNNVDDSYKGFNSVLERKYVSHGSLRVVRLIWRWSIFFLFIILIAKWESKGFFSQSVSTLWKTLENKYLQCFLIALQSILAMINYVFKLNSFAIGNQICSNFPLQIRNIIWTLTDDLVVLAMVGVSFVLLISSAGRRKVLYVFFFSFWVITLFMTQGVQFWYTGPRFVIERVLMIIILALIYGKYYEWISVHIENRPYLMTSFSLTCLFLNYILIVESLPSWMWHKYYFSLETIQKVAEYYFERISLLVPHAPILYSFAGPLFGHIAPYDELVLNMAWILSGFFVIPIVIFIANKSGINQYLRLKTLLLIAFCGAGIFVFSTPIRRELPDIAISEKIQTMDYWLENMILEGYNLQFVKMKSNINTKLHYFSPFELLKPNNNRSGSSYAQKNIAYIKQQALQYHRDFAVYKIVQGESGKPLLKTKILIGGGPIFEKSFEGNPYSNWTNGMKITKDNPLPLTRFYLNSQFSYGNRVFLFGSNGFPVHGPHLLLKLDDVFFVFADNPAVIEGIRNSHKIVVDMSHFLLTIALLIGIMLFALIFWFLKPIRALTQATSAVAAGDLDTRVPVNRSDEIGQLSKSFNEMVYGLKMKEFIKSTFDRYVSHEVAEKILENPESVRPISEKRNISVMFADIRSFTIYAESHTPEKVAGTLNEFFETMVETAFEFEGTVDKFIGDCIMIVFGAPLNQPDHPERAVKCALAMKNALVQLNGVRENRGEKPINIGIGINSGEAMVGSVGATRRLEFSVIGDCVNLAARLEDLAVEGQILIGPGTYDKVRDIVKVKSLPPQSVKGKSKPVELYEVISMNLKSS